MISINATAIVIFGQLTIGTAAQQFSNKVNITLFSNGTQEQYVSYPAFNGSLQSVGEKVFAVVRSRSRLFLLLIAFTEEAPKNIFRTP